MRRSLAFVIAPVLVAIGFAQGPTGQRPPNVGDPPPAGGSGSQGGSATPPAPNIKALEDAVAKKRAEVHAKWNAAREIDRIDQNDGRRPAKDDERLQEMQETFTNLFRFFGGDGGAINPLVTGGLAVPHVFEKRDAAFEEARKAQAELNKMTDALAKARGPSNEPAVQSVLQFVEDADRNRSLGIGVNTPDKAGAQTANESVLRFADDADVNRSLGIGVNTPDKAGAQLEKLGRYEDAELYPLPRETLYPLPRETDAKKPEPPPGGPVSMLTPSGGGPMTLGSFASTPVAFDVPGVEKTPSVGTFAPVPYPGSTVPGPITLRLGFSGGPGGNAVSAMFDQLNPAVINKAMRDRLTQLGAGFWEEDTLELGRLDIEPPSLTGTLLSVLRAVLAGTPVQAATKPAVYFSNTGRSTGPGAIEMTYVGDAPPPDNTGRMVVLEPVSSAEAAKIDRERRQTPRARTFTKTLTMYCLNHDLKVPGAGQFMKLADAATHQKFAHVVGIRDAATRLKSGGQLHPDTDGESYFHAAVQWAIWTVEKRFTDRSYAEAFVQQTRKNVEATGTAWSAETDGLVRQLAPGRWRDIQAVLQSARLVN